MTKDLGDVPSGPGLSPSVEPLWVSPPAGASIPIAVPDFPSMDPICEATFGVGWIYRDVSWMPESDWARLMDIIGDGVGILAKTTRADRVRGQLCISPDGVRRLKDAAQGIEARRADSVHESPVAEGDAP